MPDLNANHSNALASHCQQRARPVRRLCASLPSEPACRYETIGNSVQKFELLYERDWRAKTDGDSVAKAKRRWKQPKLKSNVEIASEGKEVAEPRIHDIVQTALDPTHAQVNAAKKREAIAPNLWQRRETALRKQANGLIVMPMIGSIHID